MAELAPIVTIVDSPASLPEPRIRPIDAKARAALRQDRIAITIATPADFISMRLTPAAVLALAVALERYFAGDDGETEGDELA